MLNSKNGFGSMTLGWSLIRSSMNSRKAWRTKPVADAVGKNTEMGVGDAEVADELRDGIFGKVAAVLFALNQYGRLAALRYGVVNLLAPLYPNVGGEFGTTSVGSKMSYPSI